MVEGLGVAFGLANVVGAVGGVAYPQPAPARAGGSAIAGSLLRMHVAAIPAMIFAWAAMFMVGVILAPGPRSGWSPCDLGGSGALLLYLLFARALGISRGHRPRRDPQGTAGPRGTAGQARVAGRALVAALWARPRRAAGDLPMKREPGYRQSKQGHSRVTVSASGVLRQCPGSMRGLAWCPAPRFRTPHC